MTVQSSYIHNKSRKDTSFIFCLFVCSFIYFVCVCTYLQMSKDTMGAIPQALPTFFWRQGLSLAWPHRLGYVEWSISMVWAAADLTGVCECGETRMSLPP